MFNLLLNENMKIYRRWRTWIMIILMLSVVILSGVLMYSISGTSQENWQATMQTDLAYSKELLDNLPDDDPYASVLAEQIAREEYQLAHNIPPMSGTVWSAVLDSSFIIWLITIFTVIIASDIIAGEFSSGTIKLLLIRPVRRWKILLSKYLASLLFGLTLLILLFLSSFVFNSFLYGWEYSSMPYLVTDDNGVIQERSMLLYIWATYGLSAINLLMIVTFSFMLSALFTNSSLAIGLSIFLLFTGQTATSILAARYEWAKYSLFANIDLTQYWEGSPLVEGMTLRFSIMILIVYYVLFVGLAWWVFTRRDVRS